MLPQFTDEARRTLKDLFLCKVFMLRPLDRDSGAFGADSRRRCRRALTQPGKRTGKIYYVQVEGIPG